VTWRLSRSRGLGLSTLVPLVALTATAGHAANEALGLTQKFELVQGLRLTALFFTAGSLQLMRDRMPLRGDWALLASGLLPGVLFLKGASLGLYPLLLAYTVLWFALVPGGVLVHYRRLGDYSYGLYLWQFPVQQCLVRAMPTLSPGALMAWSFPITLVFAMLSWRFLEAPALARKPAVEVKA
jgi:peptidoglycan/LPS O-acetylase OafA/YrhL